MTPLPYHPMSNWANCVIHPSIVATTQWDQEKSSRGKKFKSPKNLNFFPLELFLTA